LGRRDSDENNSGRGRRRRQGKTCERTRRDAFEILLAQAQRRGANGVVGIRYDATEIMSGVTEVICYGTAVVVEPLGEAE